MKVDGQQPWLAIFRKEDSMRLYCEKELTGESSGYSF